MRRGAADAALVYATDVRATDGSVTALPIPARADVTISFPITVLTARRNPDTALAFLRYLLSPAAGSTLSEAGWRPVPATR